MKTKHFLQKSTRPICRLLPFIVMLFLFTKTIKAQTVTQHVITAPCNCDGVIYVDFTGFTNPTTVYWNTSSGYFSHTIYLGNTDTFRNFCGGSLIVSASDMSNYAYSSNTYGPFSLSISTTPAVCPSLGTASVSVTGGTPPFSVTWEDPITHAPIATGTPATLPSGDYFPLVVDAMGCTLGVDDSLGLAYINNITSISYSINTTDANCTNGTATITGLTGGTAPYSYLWSNGATTSSISGLSMGYYTVTVSDALGCYNTQYTYISQPSVNIISNSTVTPATCLLNDGAIIAFGSGGIAPYTYLWSTGATTQSINSVSGNNSYRFTVTDSRGCIGIDYSYVPATTPISVTYTSTPSSCTAPTGSATLNITGGTAPYTVTWYTYPISSGITLSGQAAGNYSFHVVDATGCVQNGTVIINPISMLTASISTSNPTCPSTTCSASISVSGGTAPYTYLWNDLSTSSSYTASSVGSYNCTVTDALSCSKRFYGDFEQQTPISLSVSTTNTSCLFALDGTAHVTATGGTGPYSYNWGTGPGSSSITGLGVGWHDVVVSDANGCSNSYDFYIGNNATTNACYCTIEGTVYNDINSNCIKEVGEDLLQGIQIHCSGIGYTYTDALGHYSFRVPTGSYVISEEITLLYPLTSCQSNNIPVSVVASSGCTQTVDFADSLIVQHDLQIITMDGYSSAIIPGNIYTQYVYIVNNGNTTETTAQFGYKHDGQLPITSFSTNIINPTPTTCEESGSFPTLAPGQSTMSYINYFVPTNIPIGTPVLFKDTTAVIAPTAEWINDYTPWNNVNYFTGYVVSSYDPNFKEVSPKGRGSEGFISKNENHLTYTIHFQNTGTANAQNIELIDTLDDDLDWASLDPVIGSHNFTTTMNENGVVKFKFNNINLPYSGAASNGFVTYNINTRSDLNVGTQIKNSADIYFDYNAPIKTNTTLNTLDTTWWAVGIQPNTIASSFNWALFPNPTADQTTLKISSIENNKQLSIRIFSITGQSISSQDENLIQGENLIEINTSKLIAGTYFVYLNDGINTSTKKLVIVK